MPTGERETMRRFKVVEGEHVADGKPKFAVVDTHWKDLPVAHFSNRQDAEAHIEKLESGPLAWEDQEAWQDEWDDEDQ